jgi:hypothetical protein
MMLCALTQAAAGQAHLLAIDALATSAVASCEVAALAHELQCGKTRRHTNVEARQVLNVAGTTIAAM